MTICKKCQQQIADKEQMVIGKPDGLFSKGSYHKTCYDNEHEKWLQWFVGILMFAVTGIIAMVVFLI